MAKKAAKKAAKTTTFQIQSATNRLRLKAQPRAYFVKLGAGAWIGYRKPVSGPGSWVARVATGRGQGWEKTLWTADDGGLKADGDQILSFWQAKTAIQGLIGHAEGAILTPAASASMTVGEALTQYEPTLRERGASLHNANLPRRHLSDTLLSKPVALLSEQDLKGFRDALIDKGLVPASVNRIMSPLRAALTIADKTRVHIWRAGLKALNGATRANNTVIPDEATAARWVAATYAYDRGLGLLTHVLGETGARPSQCARLMVGDLIADDTPRLMMPKSGKGGTRRPGERKLERYSVPISPALAAQLTVAATNRPSSAPLLLRTNGQPWREPNFNYQYARDVKAIVASIGLDPGAFGLYAFRHTSITRMLLRGVPTAVVAKAHDTGEAMIRSHYAAYILDHADQLTRTTLPALGPAVVPMASRRV
jgi:integrase